MSRNSNSVSKSHPVEHYEKSGIGFPVSVLKAAEVDYFRSAVEELQEALGGKPSAEDMAQTHIAFKWAHQLVTHTKILDAVEMLIGPNLLVWSTSIFAKYPRDPGFISWHQDGTYWGLDSYEVATAWVALTNSTVENGCMRVVPGSHRQPIHKHVDTYAENNQLSRGQEIAVDVDEKDALEVVLNDGEMSLHHVNIIHGSNANSSDGKRIGFVIRYITPSTRQSGHSQPVTLVRGIDEYGHFDLITEGPTVGIKEGLATHQKNTRALMESLRKTKGAY